MIFGPSPATAVLKVKGIFWRFKGLGKVDGKEVASGEFLAAVQTPEGKVPDGMKKEKPAAAETAS